MFAFGIPFMGNGQMNSSTSDRNNVAESSQKKNDGEMHESIQELQYKVQSILLTNEMVDSKLCTLTKKEKEHNEIIEMLLNEIKSLKTKNDMIIDLLREYKDMKDIFNDKFDTIEKRLTKLENDNNDELKDDVQKISRSDYIPNKRPCFILIFNNESKMTSLENKLMPQEQLFLVKSRDEENTFEIYNSDLFYKYISIILNVCSEVIFDNIDKFDIRDTLILSNDVTLYSTIRTNMKFSNNANIIIDNKANVIINKFNILNCNNYGDGHLIEIKSNSNLDFKNGFVEGNTGQKSIFLVGKNGNICLNETVFNNNILASDENASCVEAQSNGNIYINKCEFMNHRSQICPNSAKLINAKGNLNIISSNFKNNNPEKNYISCISVSGRAIININDIKYEKCYQINFQQCHQINITNSLFIENKTSDQLNSCINIKNCGNTNITNCQFRKNISKLSSGAIFNKNSGKFHILNCTFEENSSECKKCGGGAIYCEETEMSIVNCYFYKNLSKSCGGAIRDIKSKLNCSNCTFDSNMSEKRGGALSLEKVAFIETIANKYQSNEASVDNDIFMM